MKAIFFKKHGDSTVLEYGNLPDPTPTADHALIKVKAVALNHLDIWVRRGWPNLKLNLPHIGGSDIAGEILQLPHDTSVFQVGQKVIIYPGINLVEDEWTRKGDHSLSPGYKVIGEHIAGGLAEYVSVPISCLIPVETCCSWSELAAPNLVALTVWRMLFKQALLKPGESVLVVGSGGGVNSLSIQIASKMGCHVLALAGNAKKAKQAEGLGCHRVIRYDQNQDWHKEILASTKGRGVDLVVDNVGQTSFNKSLKCLRPGGRVVTVGNTSGYTINYDNRLVFAKQLSIIGSTMGSKQDLLDALDFMQRNQIKISIDSVSPLADGIQQLERLEAGQHFGKIVLMLN